MSVFLDKRLNNQNPFGRLHEIVDENYYRNIHKLNKMHAHASADRIVVDLFEVL